MEPIVKLTVETKDKYDPDFYEIHTHFFHSDKDALKWCLRDCEPQVLEWFSAPLQPHTHWTFETELEHNGLIVAYHIAPITITVMDEEDGEV